MMPQNIFLYKWFHKEPLTSEEPYNKRFFVAKEDSSDYKKVRTRWFFKEPLTEWFFVEPKWFFMASLQKLFEALLFLRLTLSKNKCNFNCKILYKRCWKIVTRLTVSSRNIYREKL